MVFPGKVSSRLLGTRNGTSNALPSGAHCLLLSGDVLDSCSLNKKREIEQELWKRRREWWAVVNPPPKMWHEPVFNLLQRKMGYK